MWLILRLYNRKQPKKHKKLRCTKIIARHAGIGTRRPLQQPWRTKPMHVGGPFHAHAAPSYSTYPSRAHKGHMLLPLPVERVTTLHARGPVTATRNVRGVSNPE